MNLLLTIVLGVVLGNIAFKALQWGAVGLLWVGVKTFEVYDDWRFKKAHGVKHPLAR